MEQQNNTQSNEQQSQVITWPIVNTELQDHFDSIKSTVRGLYQMASQQKMLAEKLKQENAALKAELDKVNKKRSKK